MVMEWYRPQAVFLQCGADSLTGDRLGPFNLTIEGHGRCVEFVKSFGLPMLVAGGGGYTVRNVARCWTYETAVLLGEKLDNQLPYHDYLAYYGPEYFLDLTPSNMANLNTREELDGILEKVTESMRHMPCAPSVPLAAVDPAKLLDDSDESDDMDYDDRLEGRYLTTRLRLNMLERPPEQGDVCLTPLHR